LHARLKSFLTNKRTPRAFNVYIREYVGSSIIFFFGICTGLKQCFYRQFLKYSKLKGKEMIEQEFLHDNDSELAEKCRRALEKSLGIDNPLPKYMIKRANMQKIQRFLGRENVQK